MSVWVMGKQYIHTHIWEKDACMVLVGQGTKDLNSKEKPSLSSLNWVIKFW